jgi:hypothetical protein
VTAKILYRVVGSEANSMISVKLQEDLDRLQNWEKTWLISFNPDKCEVIRITNDRNIIKASYTIHGQVLQMTNKAKYLRITTDCKLLWGPHISKHHKEGHQHQSLSSEKHLELLQIHQGDN